MKPLAASPFYFCTISNDMKASRKKRIKRHCTFFSVKCFAYYWKMTIFAVEYALEEGQWLPGRINLRVYINI